MLWDPMARHWMPMSKRARKLAQAKTQERAKEWQAHLAAKRAAEVAKKRASWDRMKADIARKYSAVA